MIDGTLAFAGRIGEDAMRECIAEIDDVNFSYQRSLRNNSKEHGDEVPF